MKKTYQYIFVFLLFLCINGNVGSAIVHTPIGTRLVNIGKLQYSYLKGTSVVTIESNIVSVFVEGGGVFGLSKTAFPMVVLPGDTLLFKLIARNTGNDILTNILVVDTLPPQVLSFSPNGRISSDPIIRWNIDTLQPGQIDTFTIVTLVDSTLSLGSAIRNSAYGGEIGDTVTTASVEVKLGSEPHFVLRKKDSKSTAFAGDTLTYTLTYSNDGNVDGTGIHLYDNISNGLQFLSASNGGTFLSSIVSWSIGNLPSGTIDSVQLIVRIPGNTPQGSRFLNTGLLTANGGFSSVSNEDTTYIRGIIPSHIHLLAVPHFLIGNGIDQSILTATLGDSLGNPVPDGTPVTFSTTAGKYSNGLRTIVLNTINGIVTTSLTANLVSNQIQTAIAGVSAGVPGVGTVSDSVTIIFYPGAITGIVRDNRNGAIVNGAAVVAYSSSDIRIGNDTTKNNEAFIIPVAQSDTFKTIVQTLNSFGTMTASTSKVFVDVPGSGGNPAIDNGNSISGSLLIASNGTRFDSAGIIIARKSVTSGFVVDSTVSDSLGGYVFNNVLAGGYEIFTTQFVDTSKVTIHNIVNGEFIINANIGVTLRAPILAFTKSVDKDSVLAGDSLRYVLRVHNAGNVPITNLNVVDTLSSQFTNIRVSQNAQLTGNVVAFHKNTLLLNESDSVFINANIDGNVHNGDRVKNYAYAVSTNTPQQVDSALSVAVAHPQLLLKKSVSQDSIIVGDTILYHIRFKNSGDVALLGFQLRDTLPVYQLSNIVVSPNAQLFDSIITFDRDTIGVNREDSITVSASVRVNRPSGEIIRNSVVAQSVQTPLQSSQVQSVILRRDSFSLSLSKTVSGDTIYVGDSLRYLILIHNNGNSPLTNVTMRDTLPAEIVNVRVSLNATLSNGVVSFIKNVITVNEIDTVFIDATLSPQLPSGLSVRNAAYSQSNQTATQAAEVRFVTKRHSTANLSLAKIVSTDSISVGDSLKYVILFGNSGNVNITNLVLVDTIPAQLFRIHISPNAQLVNGTVQLSRDTLFTGQIDSVLVSATVAFNTPDTIHNIVYAKSLETQQQSAAAQTKIIHRATNHSCLISINGEPLQIIGNGITASIITVVLTDTLGNPKPDGTPITLQSLYSQAKFSNGENIIVIPTHNGIAVDSMKGLIITYGVIHTSIIASATGDLCNASDSIEITLFPGAVSGVVKNQGTQLPVQGAIVQVFSSTDTLVGGQTTLSDGKYLVPVPKTDMYRVEITTTNLLNQSSTSITNVSITVPGTGGNAPTSNKNSILGVIYSIVSGHPVPLPQIHLILTLLPAPSPAKHPALKLNDNVTGIDSAVTDSLGSYRFTNIQQGRYEIAIRDARISGKDTVTNNGNGELLIDVNIPVVLSPLLEFLKSGPASAGESDTVLYSISYGNTGTLSITNAVITDSLDPMMIFLSATNGGLYDSVYHTVHWAVGVVDTQASGFVSVAVKFADTLTSNYSVTNRAFFTSSQTPQTLSSVQTLIGIPANIRIWKTSSTHNAQPGDTITYFITATNIAGARADSIHISDVLPAEVMFLSSTPSPADTSNHTVSWGTIDSLPAGDTLSFRMKVIVGNNLSPGEHQYTNIASLIWNNGSISSFLDSASNAKVTTVISYLRITKQAVKKVLEVGDIATYIIRVTNASSTSIAESVEVIDDIPFGFRYVKNSSFIGNTKIPEPLGTKQLRWKLTNALSGNETVQLIYRLVIGAGGVDGNGINTARAVAVTSLGVSISSAQVSEKVEVLRGIFSGQGLIIGKVFFDVNENAYQDSGEAGVKGVELMMEDGTRVITGDDGKYSLPDVTPGDHFIKVRKHTLPPNSELLSGYDDFADEPSSRFVLVTESGIARADFYLKTSVSTIEKKK